MRKNFTQLFLGLALMVGFATMGYSQCEIPPPEGAIYNFQFDGGLEGWRSLDAAGGETTFGWAYTETADISMGAYGPPDGTVMDSPSQCNGAIVFDSDFLDNDGIQGNFGMGDCPATCEGFLVSPPMDLSGATEELEIIFYQAVRQFNSEFNIYISLDGGLTNADTVDVNDLMVTNAGYVERLTRLPACDIVPLAGESNVVVTFHYSANYYFWGVDDFSVVPSETIDLKANRNFYAKMPNYMTPKNMGTDVPMLIDIENTTTSMSPASTVEYSVFEVFEEDDPIELFNASLDYEAIAPCAIDENKVFGSLYTMPNEVGDYALQYELITEGDNYTYDNFATAPFRISDREFRKLPSIEEVGFNYLSGVRFGGSGFVSAGSYFYIPQNAGEQAIESVSLGVVTNAGELPSPGTITVSVYQWIDLNEDGESTEDERVPLGSADYFILPTNTEEFLQFSVTPLDASQQMIVPAPGAELLVMAHSRPFNSETNYFFNCAYIPRPRNLVYAADATNLAHREANVIGGASSFASGAGDSEDDFDTRLFFNTDVSDTDGDQYMFDFSLTLTAPTSTENINEDISVSIFPSPASDKLNIDLSLEELSNKVSVEITDMTGNRTGMYNFSNIKKDVLSIDVSDLINGMYIVNIRTEDGMISKKVSVIH